MGRIVISENISLDGVIEDAPTGPDGVSRGGWLGCVSDADRAEWAAVEYAEARAASALLMGRASYDWFVERGWPSKAGGWADQLRALPKYVATSTPLDDPAWAGSTALTGDLAEEVTKLTDQVDGDIVVYGSGRLTRAMFGQGLVDEVRLMTYPIVVGAGFRLFPETPDPNPVRLASVRTVGSAIVQLTYRRS